MPYGALSGGNQQKALLAKWLQTRPKLLLLHEPTQGVDVGARQQIFALVRQAADAGVYVLCASSDYEQLALICDRVLVFGRGRVARQLVGAQVTKERIIEQSYAAMAAEAAVLAR
jgi:ribose transport system ATP-binding protein